MSPDFFSPTQKEAGDEARDLLYVWITLLGTFVAVFFVFAYHALISVSKVTTGSTFPSDVCGGAVVQGLESEVKANSL